MKLNFILFFTFVVNSNLFSSEIVNANCSSGIGETINKSNESLTGCDAARISLKSDPTSDLEYRRKINQKLSKSIALQTKQILQVDRKD